MTNLQFNNNAFQEDGISGFPKKIISTNGIN